MTTGTELKGSCLCGAVYITAKTAGSTFGACHCSTCRKWAGGPLLAMECSGEVRLDGIGSVSVYDSSAWAERGFCKTCGTHLFYRLEKEQHYAIPLGLFDGARDWHFESQIFIEEKPAHYAFANETKNLTGAEVFAQFEASSK